MTGEQRFKTDIELFEKPADDPENNPDVRILHLLAAELEKHLYTNVYVRSSMFILVLNGTAIIEINFKEYEASRGKLVLLSFGHFFKIKQISSQFRCMVLYISKQYIEEMYSADMLYKRIKYGVKMHQSPLLKPGLEERILMQQRLEFIGQIAANLHHRYYKEMILHALLIFLLDLSHIIEGMSWEERRGRTSRDELHFHQFLELLVTNYRSEHQVEFYAGKLNITPHYLTLIVKRLSGQTVSGLIFELLFTEAKLLLKQPNMPIQAITAEFHFSDQSAFGKFFKRKSGLSPKDFRRKMIG